MGRPKKIKIAPVATEAPAPVSEVPAKSQKQIFEEIHASMKMYGINSISDVENLIARS